ncbi:MAG: sulfurtransferase TusA family protein [Candidatus Hermodarchaeota archaeon]
MYEVWSKDAGSIRDIPKWVEKAKHEMVAIVEANGHTKFAVKKLR